MKGLRESDPGETLEGGGRSDRKGGQLKGDPVRSMGFRSSLKRTQAQP